MTYDEDRIAASVLIRVSYDLKGEHLAPSDEQPWIVSREAWTGPQGPMDGDFIFYKDGVDVFLFGRAVAEKQRPVREMGVHIGIGATFRRSVRVFGARVWYRRAASLVPTTPRSFVSLPLTLNHAYGGKDLWDGLDIPFQENPDGTGFYLEEKNAVDKPLPLIEEPDALIKRWDDRPTPAGLVQCPPASPLRVRRGMVQNPDGLPKIKACLYNAAFSPMIAKSILLGDAVHLLGTSERGPMHFNLPKHEFFVKLRFGAESHELPLRIDQVGIEVDENRAFVAYRLPFRYVVHALQERECVLFERSFHR